jgi:hypothetical protein
MKTKVDIKIKLNQILMEILKKIDSKQNIYQFKVWWLV